MKKLILFLVVFIPVSILAQNEASGNKEVMDNQVREWMDKISSDSEMRSQMTDMMIEKTKGNKEEMAKLVNSFTSDYEMNKMMMDKIPKKANSKYSLQPRKMMSDSVRVIKMESVKPVPKKIQ